MSGTGSVLVGADYPSVDSDRPSRALVRIGITAQLVEDPHPRTIA
jgi:hypothetical protein